LTAIERGPEAGFRLGETRAVLPSKELEPSRGFRIEWLSRTHLSLQRRQRAGRSHPGAGCVPRPAAAPSQGLARRGACASREARHVAGAGGGRARVSLSRMTTRRCRSGTRRPPSTARAGHRVANRLRPVANGGRARRLGEAGSAERPLRPRALDGGGNPARLPSGRRRNPAEGSNPSLSATAPSL